MTGIELIAEERKEQLKKHNWTIEHDKQHVSGELAKVAAVLAVMGTDAVVHDPGGYETGNNNWGLERKLSHDNIHRLRVAGALIAAEIDRLQNT